MKRLTGSRSGFFRWLLPCGLLLVVQLQFATADIYKWTDEQGRVHFGDSPRDRDQATKLKVNVNSIPVVTPGENSTATPATTRPNVVMYSTSWCSYCKQARRYFKSKGIRFSEYDIEQSASAKARYDALGGKAVPLIVVGERSMQGFTPAGFEQLYR